MEKEEIKEYYLYLIENQRIAFKRFADVLANIPRYTKTAKRIQKYGEEHYKENLKHIDNK
jgi:hypothetical protein